ncbi:MAG: type secretion outer membrane protein TolC family [Betaproteobacteria bacterium]|nr:type secretion outer membrane protein TolC family [Betaproteobacteria bacterium]
MRGQKKSIPPSRCIKPMQLSFRALSACIVLCAMAPLDASAAAADLLSIYREAQTADPVYSGARATYAAGQEKLPQGLAGLLPGVTATGNTQYNDRDLQFRGAAPNLLSGASRFNSNGISVTATQPLFRFQNWITYEQAKKQVSQAEATFLQANQDLIIRVAQTYFDILLAENNVTLAAAQKTAFAEQLAQAKRNFEVGTATITDANDAQARHDLAVSQEIAAQNDLEIKKQSLRQIIGRVAPPITPIGNRFTPQLPAPNNMDQWVDNGALTSYQVKVAQANVDIAGQEVSKNRAGHLPTLDAVASYNEASQGAGFQVGPGFDTTNKIIGLQLAVPLYQGGAINSRVREAIANQDKARDDLENTKRTVALNTRASFLSVTNGVAQIKALETALASSQSSLDSTKLGREVGVRTEVDVLNAQQQVISTRRDYAQAIYTYAINVLKLKGAAGTLSDEDLAYVNQWLAK